jgi:hypothetical protein
MFALDLRRVPLARVGLVGIEMPCVRTPIIGRKTRQAQRLEQRFQLEKPLVLTPAKDLRQYRSRLVLERLPQPALHGLLPHIGPHRITCRFINPLEHYAHLVRMPCVEERWVHRGARRLFFATCS